MHTERIIFIVEKSIFGLATPYCRHRLESAFTVVIVVVIHIVIKLKAILITPRITY